MVLLVVGVVGVVEDVVAGEPAEDFGAESLLALMCSWVWLLVLGVVLPSERYSGRNGFSNIGEI